MTVPQRVAAIVTAYHPDDRLLAVLRAAAESCDPVLVVDNTPGGAAMLSAGLPDRVRVLRPDGNLGLAGALNLGRAELGADEGIEAVLLLDQDSVLPAGIVHDLAAHLADAGIGAAAPAPWNAENGSYIDPRTALRPAVADRPAVITSGLLVRTSVLDAVGGFREDFFVDCVDLDFCLRVWRAGSRIVQDKNVKLPHTLGDSRLHRFGPARIRVSHHAAWRVYWFFRNEVVLVKENWRSRPAWCASVLLVLVRWTLLTALYEKPRGPRLRAILRGLRDGVTGRTTRSYLPNAEAVPVGVDSKG